MDPNREAIPFIEDNLSIYDLQWKNTDRTSNDWKVKLYEQKSSKLQFAIYDRKKTIIRLQHYDTTITGVKNLETCPKSDGLNIFLSNFKDGSGVCVEVSDRDALTNLLNYYFSVSPITELLEDVIGSFEKQVSNAKKRTAVERKERLALASKKPRQQKVITTVFIRNPDVVAEVLERAIGYCELCRSPAPFKKASNAEPYLEVHHKIRLADDGEDSVENAIALCPNCHRKQHYG